MATWQEDNWDVLADVKLSELLLPGSHDSGSSVLSSKRLSSSLRDLALSAAVRTARPLIAAWTLAQDMSVRQQLDAGLRLIDLRVSYCSVTPSFFVTHTFSCIPLERVTSDLCDFLACNQREVVVVRVSPDFAHASDFKGKCVQLCSQLTTQLRGHLFDHGKLTVGDWPTLADFVEAQTRCALFVEVRDGDASVTGTCGWVNEDCASYWADSSTARGTLEGLQALIALDQKCGRGTVHCTDWSYR
jgi:hypothetical protein